MPYISVIVPAYNSASTIKECLDAVRRSDFRDYELIVIDGASQDSTVAVSKKYANLVIELSANAGRSHARRIGFESSKGRIIVNIDSDVLIKTDTLSKIAAYLSRHPEIDAVTGLLSKEHPNPDFFSQYKNLYMHYIFKKLPERANFLYGSIYALKREALETHDADIEIADDTALGQRLISYGKQIAFLNDLEVVHLKKYTFITFIRNDFRIPFDWAKIFLKYKGWKQLGRDKTGYAHSPKRQLLSVITAPIILILALGLLFGHAHLQVILLLFLCWLLLNYGFFIFLMREKGLFYSLFALPVTFLDNLIMAAGILCGALSMNIKEGRL
ncbi:MAG TPA: glycosyltransferase family 2 protein [Candidatus Margulisiibacteriota bacterium]|nr:glycosyltransferase family 2 protein [Candidatus Margulisiibacteriota bacterium]